MLSSPRVLMLLLWAISDGSSTTFRGLGGKSNLCSGMRASLPSLKLR